MGHGRGGPYGLVDVPRAFAAPLEGVPRQQPDRWHICPRQRDLAVGQQPAGGQQCRAVVQRQDRRASFGMRLEQAGSLARHVVAGFAQLWARGDQPPWDHHHIGFSEWNGVGDKRHRAHGFTRQFWCVQPSPLNRHESVACVGHQVHRSDRVDDGPHVGLDVVGASQDADLQARPSGCSLLCAVHGWRFCHHVWRY